MMDNDYRIRRLKQEAADEEVGVILFDLVLGEGAHPDPASELAPVIAEIHQQASQSNRALEFVCIVIGTEDDPQDLAHQIEQMQAVGAAVFQDIGEAIATVINFIYPFQSKPSSQGRSDMLSKPISAINIGLRSFSESLRSQGAEAVDVDWRPPASGDDRLASLLSKMK